jgi:hypothetical protein
VPDRPLLFFPTKEIAPKRSKGGGGNRVAPRSAADQRERVRAQLETLEALAEEKQAWFQANANGIAPNTVLVIELAKPIDRFAAAAAKVGIPILGEADGDEFTPDTEGFSVTDSKGNSKDDKPIESRVYLHSFNLGTAETFRKLFENWRDGKPWASGTTPWRDVFDCILRVRQWNASDRLRDSGLLEDWQQRIADGATELEFEADFWFELQGQHSRARMVEIFGERLAAIGGTIRHQAVISEISYHGVLGRIPVAAVGNLQALDALEFVQFDGVFEFHPVTQAVSSEDIDTAALVALTPSVGTPDAGAPAIVGLIDGVPVQNHPDLIGGVQVIDTDGLEAQAPAAGRQHGTAMASLIVNGDLTTTQAKLSRPIQIRPVLVPRPTFHGGTVEQFPDGRLALDTFHRAIRDLVATPAQSEIRVVNVSLGDPNRRLIRSMSPWARLLDWAAHQYRILFIVSAGNCVNDIALPFAPHTAHLATQEDMQSAVLKDVYVQARRRTLLSPAEAVNALTIGAAHDDASVLGGPPTIINPIASAFLPSPITPVGPGYGSAIKPDCLAIGGRQRFREPVAYAPGAASSRIQIQNSNGAPGVLVAAPQFLLNSLSRSHTRGTSVAAALTTRLAAEIFEEIAADPSGDEAMSRRYAAVVLKALVAHSTTWESTAATTLTDVLQGLGVPNRKLKENLSRFLGHGNIRPDRAYKCNDQRVTVIGYGELAHGDSHVFKFPWPTALRASVDERRLTITLASLVPTMPGNYSYRGADVWVSKPGESKEFGLKAGDRDDKAVQRGTLQHVCYSGKSAAAFDDGAGLTLQVSCRAVAMDEHALPAVPYALVVSLEVAEETGLPIYSEVELGLQAQVPIPLANP